ncbi:hypothetical protein AB0O57_12020 [Streptomyces sp. NPDC091201]|uniref:hypothetical protein n=1 Tax=Streptomyces sp. NPDC091201 TaxID=3155190 RepID=UPI00342DC374
MTGVADEGTGGGTSAGGEGRPARRPLNPLKPEVFRNRPHKRALVEHLRALIEAADLASKQVAPGVSLSASALSKNLSGNRLPHRSTVEAIIQLCGAAEEVRAQSLRLHTAALGETHPAFAERLVLADAYEETVLLHDRAEARLAAALDEHRRRQADYDDLRVRHETTLRALATAEDELRTRREQHQRETARLKDLLREEKDARRSDRTAFDGRLDQARAGHEEQLRARQAEGESLRRDLLAQEDRIHTVRGLLDDSAAEATALRQERDRLRVESARLREDLVGLQVELAAAEAGQDTHVEEGTLAPALLAVSQVLDRRPDDRGTGETAGRAQVDRGASRPGAGVGAPQPDPMDSPAGLKWVSGGTAAFGLLLVAIGLFLHTGGPTSQARPSTGVGWLLGVGIFLLVAGLIVLAARDVHSAPSVDPDDSYPYTCGFPPLM